MRFAPAFWIIGMLIVGHNAVAASKAKDKSTATQAMNETDKYILEQIRLSVWSGFYSAKEVDEMIDDILEDDANEAMLRAAVLPEFEKKRQAEPTWPKITDFDRLQGAFVALDKQNILCLHNAGYTMSDGHEDAAEALAKNPRKKYVGYCFYHGQDLERAINGTGLMLAFDHVDGDVPDKLKVGIAIKSALEAAGFSVTWDGTTEQRINIPKFDWKHRYR